MIEDLFNLVGKAEDQAQVQDGTELNNSPAAPVKESDLEQWLPELGVSNSTLRSVVNMGFRVSITIGDY
jgi:hypothetical protein